MKRKVLWSLAFVILMAGSVMVGGAGPRVPRLSGASDSESDPYKGATVLTEAFVVEVELSALYEMDVSPLGQEPHSVSTEDILERLHGGGGAQVLLGVKAAGHHHSNRNQARETKTTYYPRTHIVNTSGGRQENVDYTPYDYGQTLTVMPSIRSDHRIDLQYDFEYSGVRTHAQHSERPPDIVSWSWDGEISLQAGMPMIVGAMQDDESAIFLILTAHILN